jgi:ubiquinone/menaquinone biosynthesis C-methylase UbiE
MNEDILYSKTANAFTEASQSYDSKISGNFINMAIRNVELDILIRYSSDRTSILEIGCGTGQEALKFISSTGKNVEAIDISPGMVDLAISKMEKHGVKDRFAARVMPARDIALIQKKFDLIYSFNGALNTEPEISHFFNSLAGATEHDALFVFKS